MGVVDYDAEPLAAVDSLHASGHSPNAGQPGPNCGGFQLQHLAESDRGQDVGDVEATDEPHSYLAHPAWRLDLDSEPAGILRDCEGAHVRLGREAVRDERGSGRQRRRLEEGRGGVVVVDDRRARPLARQALARLVGPQSPEEVQLGLAVRFEGAVELEVLVAQVGEDRDVIGDAPDAIESQPVRGGFDDRGPITGFDHGQQSPLEARRLRRRDVLGVCAANQADLQLGCGKHAGGDPGGLQDRRGQERGRGLAVGAGDAHHSDLAARVPVPPGRGDGQSRAATVDHDLRRRQSGDGPLHHDGRRTQRNGRRHVVVAVDMLARNRYKDRPGSDTPGVEGDPPNRQRA